MMDFKQVRDLVGGLKGVITKLGDAPPNGKWNSFSQCPFCGNKDCSGVFTQEGAEFFKCHHRDCNTGGRAVTEVGFIAMRLGLSEAKPPQGGPSPAYEHLLKMANAYEAEPRLDQPREKKNDTSAKPSQPGRGPEAADRLPNAVLPENFDSQDGEALLRAAIEVIRRERRVSARVLKEHLKLGTDRAVQLIGELERRGVIGPARVGSAREILNLDLPSSQASPLGDGKAPEPDDQPQPAAESEDVGLKGSGSGDPGQAAGPTTPTAECSGPAFIGNGGPVPSESPQIEAPPPPPVAAAGEPDPKKDSGLPPGYAALRWFYAQLPATWTQLVAMLPDGLPIPDPLPTAMVKQVKFKPVELWELRALFPATCRLLGFRANPRSNEAILRELPQRFDWEEVMASGLWKEANFQLRLDRRPENQFHGKGQIGKKPEEERRDEDDKWQWGWSQPVLIPYFNAEGELIKLRPHKGGAKGGTAAGSEHIYVPRAYEYCADMPPEKFPTVIICEGEFKAAVIWQYIGAGAAMMLDYKAPVGVCALPGISFARNEDYREDLEEWLLAVDCKRVIVAFDDEDKSHKQLQQRFDAVIYARYLATDLASKLHLAGKYLKLPTEWRNAKGKADWDGAAAKLRREFLAKRATEQGTPTLNIQ